jgi:hypothetical protein
MDVKHLISVAINEKDPASGELVYYIHSDKYFHVYWDSGKPDWDLPFSGTIKITTKRGKRITRENKTVFRYRASHGPFKGDAVFIFTLPKFFVPKGDIEPKISDWIKADNRIILVWRILNKKVIDINFLFERVTKIGFSKFRLRERQKRWKEIWGILSTLYKSVSLPLTFEIKSTS